MRAKFDDLTGRVFERLTVLRYFGPTKGGALWMCQCECGTAHIAMGSNLRSGGTKSCGCLQRELRAVRGTLGMYGSRVHKCWSNMIARCEYPKFIYYKDYGGRGIKVCERWKLFANFLEDMGEPKPGMTIDRIDVDGDYTPANCRWASKEEQAMNKRNTVRIEVDGKQYTVKEIAALTGATENAIYQRRAASTSITKGWK